MSVDICSQTCWYADVGLEPGVHVRQATVHSAGVPKLQLSCLLLGDVRMCTMQTGDSNMCLAYYEHQCAGICSSEQRLEPIYEACLRDPLKKGQNARQSAIS